VEELYTTFYELRLKFLKVQKRKVQPMYLHVCEHIRNKELDSSSIPFEGKIRVIKNQIS
jgi:hypothetical protein